ncbi:MAG: ISAzo13 family transposase [Euryarchaeota archaeon]|jgi:transposase|nr:ISAzo13 family transposase [Euryarchaeota archaeon]
MQNITIGDKYELIKPYLNEKAIRLFLAAEAKSIGWGGISQVSLETGVSRNTISQGLYELNNPDIIEPTRIRKKGGGRKRALELDPQLLLDIEKLIEPVARGDPESPLRWTCKSTRTIAKELEQYGHFISHSRVADILKFLNYSLQANKKTFEGIGHEDRNSQFEFINAKSEEFLSHGQPVISIDAKKKENVGNYKNNGVTWRPIGNPENVNVYDFVDPINGKVTPYGVYDINKNQGWVNVGTDHDTAAFAVESIRRWWLNIGKNSYPDANRLFITADGGGSNGYRTRLWKVELQKLANETGLEISISHYPPGTSKWNKIEHRLFSFISLNWRGQPLFSHQVIIDLISSTKTKTGLVVQCALDKNHYPIGIKIMDKEIEDLNMTMNIFHGKWNYNISPNIS